MCDIRTVSRFVSAARLNCTDMILYFSSTMFYIIYSRSVLKCYHHVFFMRFVLRGYVMSKITCLLQRDLEGSACGLILAFP